jgi:integrase
MIYKRGKFYWYKFQWAGKLVRESTKQGNDKIARNMESAHRTSLAKGEVGIREKKIAPTLAEFLKNDFLPFCETQHAAKPNTLRYYKTGAASLTKSGLSSVGIDQITNQHAQQYAARLATLSPSTVNCGLRTLRRAIYLSAEWGAIDRRPKITLAKGEKQRDRVLSDSEVDLYLAACEQPWRTVATIMLGTGLRPGEILALRWENVLFREKDGLIQVSCGKSRAARRLLFMVPRVREALHSRWKAECLPESGWIFPAASASGHSERDSLKGQHTRAFELVNDAARKNKEPELEKFPPYIMRHTALTRFGESGCDIFTLARIAGHANISMTMRYVHPQAEAIEAAFAKFALPAQPVAIAGRHKSGHSAKPARLNAAPKRGATALLKTR